MMDDLIVMIEKSTRMVNLTRKTIGNDNENLQEKIIFQFSDEFVDGQARLEYRNKDSKNYIPLTKENETYTLPVQNVILKEGKIEMQLVITTGDEEENIPVFKSNVFYLYCNKSINAVDEAPDGYDLWIEQANAKLNHMEEEIQDKQDLLISGTNIKTINGNSLLGSGNIDVSGGASGDIWMGNSNEYIIALNNGTITAQTICLITDGDSEPTVVQDGNILYVYSGVTVNQNESELEVL